MDTVQQDFDADFGKTNEYSLEVIYAESYSRRLQLRASVRSGKSRTHHDISLQFSHAQSSCPGVVQALTWTSHCPEAQIDIVQMILKISQCGPQPAPGTSEKSLPPGLRQSCMTPQSPLRLCQSCAESYVRWAYSCEIRRTYKRVEVP